MALYPTRWELEQRELKKKAEEWAREKRKKEFVKKWVSATPEQQAEIIFDLMEDVHGAQSSIARSNLRHMRF